MSYESIVYRILIASPSDVEEEREITARIIQDWNDLNSFNKKIVLLPVRWETHSSPTYGIRPQEAINKQIVDDCDLLIGFFWTKIGTPTGEELSGTIEEIKRVANAGKPVMLYFSKRGKDPSQLDLIQLEKLKKFKKEIYSSALVENYNSSVDFRDKLSRHLEMKIRELQAEKESNKELISFAFIDNKMGELREKNIEIDIERIEIEEKRLIKIINNDKRISDKKWEFNASIVDYLNKKNNIPVVLGLKNNVNRYFGNINVELKLNSSVENSLVIKSISSSDEINLIYRIDEMDLTKENETNIRKLFNRSFIQKSESSWDFKINTFTLLPKELKIIDSLILLYPKSKMKIEFNIRLYSENILQVIEDKCIMKINYKKREITDEEINEIINKLPEEEELPF